MHKLGSCMGQDDTYGLSSFADHMGEHELAESDHTSIVNITCIERESNLAM